MGKSCDKFLLLVWKDWKLQYRRPIQTAVEIAAPIIFSILLVILRSLVDPEEHHLRDYLDFQPIITHFLPSDFNMKNVKTQNDSITQNFTLVYSPSPNKVLDHSMGILKILFKNVSGYKNSRELEILFTSERRNDIFAAVQFDDDLYNKNELPLDLHVTFRFPGELRSLTSQFSNIRTQKNTEESIIDKMNQLFMVRDWKTHLLYPVFQTPGPRNPESGTGAHPSYYKEGFLALQLITTYILIIAQKGMLALGTPPVVRMHRFPHAAWKTDPFLTALIGFIGIVIMLSFVYTCINTVKAITNEKEKQQKEAMKIMGLPNWLHWTAWFVKSFLFLLISITCMVLLLTISWYPHTTYSVFTKSNPTILFLFLVFYMCATITFCFAISVFFAKANTAAAVAGLVWFLSYTPFMFLSPQYDQLSLSTKLITSVGSNTAMAYGFQLFIMYEGTGEGIQWNNIWKPNSVDDRLSLGLILTMLALDSLLYLLIALYVEAVFPGEFGTPHPWYYPVTYKYWFGRPKHLDVPEIVDVPINKQQIEDGSSGLNPQIQIRQLRKVFGNKVAVNNLSLDIYESQITVLLGHNGAGKTTTMAMLTGIIPPTSGGATICGYDIRTNMADVRSNLGLCPQHNILFNALTVREHFYFFSKLKGLDNKQAEEEIIKYARLLELEPKMNKKSKTLSGGMKRKLCVGIALCGYSKIVLLDEPTAGIDPSSRRTLWDLLQIEKNGRCILMTTHYLDEADVLGDRIAIMADGELKCLGSSFFLKKKFGGAYHLILEKLPNCEVSQVTAFLQQYVPQIQVHTNVGSELSYLLQEQDVDVFQNLLSQLENNTTNLNIRSFGISLNTLEDVFIKVGTDPKSANTTTGQENLTKPVQAKRNYLSRELKKLVWVLLASEVSDPAKKLTHLTHLELLRNQIVAMFMKKSLFCLRTWLLQFIQILIPVAFLIIALLVSRNMNRYRFDDLPKVPLTLDAYKDSIILVEVDRRNDFSDSYFESVRKYKTENVSDITATMFNLTKIIPSTVRRQYLVGASFGSNETNDTALTAWFNNDPYHTPGVSLGLLLDAIYKTYMGRNHSITFFNHPMPYTAETKFERLLKGRGMGFQLAFNIAFSMAFVSSFYVLFYVKERVCKSKHLQLASGLRSYIFWTTCFIFDLLIFMVTILALLMVLGIFQMHGYTTAQELGRMFFLLFCFGFAMLPMMYIASYCFHIPATGYTRMTLFSVSTGVAAFVVIQILATPGFHLQHIANSLHGCFLVIPHYSLATGIRDTYITFATGKMCEFHMNTCLEFIPNATRESCRNNACNSNSSFVSNYCCEQEQHYFQWNSPGIGKNILYSFLGGTILFVLLNLNECFPKASRYVVQKIKRRKFSTTEKPMDEDQDVFDEKEKIRTTPEGELVQEHKIVLKNLTKYYKNVCVVNSMCLGIRPYECFGLLGSNGAGKTTTFKILTGDIAMTNGDAWIGGFSVKTQLRDVQKLIGYCPQFDALLPELTAKETLIIFALIRGVPLTECQNAAKKLAQEFDFLHHFNKPVKHLSGGNKRKLSTAISLIGDPPIICLDEPSAGMDPVTKRNLWNTLCAVRDSGKCILFTSHSMDECEALCTRLAIMVNGNFKCLGSIQHLKNKFASGFTLTVKIKKENADETANELMKVDTFVMNTFPSAKLQETHQEFATYYITDQKLSWSKVFGVLEKAKTQLNIEDYALGQATLEQVFLNMTRHQK